MNSRNRFCNGYIAEISIELPKGTTVKFNSCMVSVFYNVFNTFPDNM